MNPLSSADTAALTDLLISNLPQVVLDTLCRASDSSITQGGLVRDIIRYLPSTVNPDAVRDLTQASLYWLLFNGDIAAAGGQRYRIMPPYAVALPNLRNQPAGTRQVQLCGDPRRDGVIKDTLAALGGHWTHEVVERIWMVAGEYLNVPVGLRRYVTVAAGRLARARLRLQEIQVPLVEIEEIEQNLPRMVDLTIPPRGAFRAIAPASGYWSTYAPSQTGDERWVPSDIWNTLPVGLVRWMPSRDWRGERDSRYFYKAAFPEMAELSQSTAFLWMFHLDERAQRPRQLWIHGSELWLPSSIPDPHRQWLQLLAAKMRWRDQALQYDLGVDPTPVIQTLQATLGLQIVQQRPN